MRLAILILEGHRGLNNQDPLRYIQDGPQLFALLFNGLRYCTVQFFGVSGACALGAAKKKEKSYTCIAVDLLHSISV